MNGRRKPRGFTLLELMATLAVAGIVVGIGVPSLRNFMQSSSMSGAVNNLVTTALYARAEAVKRRVPVSLTFDSHAQDGPCGTANIPGSFTVALVSAPSSALKQQDGPAKSICVWANLGQYITYGANGFRTKTAGATSDSTTQVIFCDTRGNTNRGGVSTARLVAIDPLGRAQVDTSPTDIATAVHAMNLDSLCPAS